MALDRPIQIEVHGATPDEIEAILLAYLELWPEPIVATIPTQSTVWRFSGRWWVEKPSYFGSFHKVNQPN
tara:strand:- start:32 stop:241 length:210 start_codon:yes stop_codon:yes gene_type:complete